jgi:hypothetical protein
MTVYVIPVFKSRLRVGFCLQIYYLMLRGCFREHFLSYMTLSVTNIRRERETQVISTLNVPRETSIFSTPGKNYTLVLCQNYILIINNKTGLKFSL